MARNADLTATRCAILGQLALRDWGGYELTRSVRRTLRWFWPRAESVIYSEARRLEAEGLARSRPEPAVDGSERTRSVYAITDAGRRVIADWLASPPAGLVSHNEALLRVHLARFGTTADLLAAVDVADLTGRAILADAQVVAEEFVGGRHIFQEEAHVRGLLFDALSAQGLALSDWAARSRAEIERWEDIDADRDARTRAIDRMRAFLEARRGRALAP